MSYANGRVPLNLLVHINGNLYMFPGMYQRWLNLVDLVRKRHGVTLTITRGSKGWDDWNGYRTYDAQVIYRRELGNMAAVPGYSSHGGWYQGRESGAIDVWNWNAIGKTAFFQACRDVGLTPGTDSRENWHVVDFSPWAAPSGGGSTPFTPITQEEDMRVVVWEPNGTILAFAPGQVRAFEASELTQASKLATLTGRDAKGNIYRVDNDGLAGLCEGYGVPFNEGVMAALNATAWTISGKRGGRFWSREFAIHSTTKE